MQVNSLRELFVEQLRDLYNAENQIVEALPKMAGAATSTDLKEGFEHHLKQSREHINRLNTVFSMINENAQGVTCEAMKGLIKEGDEVIHAQGDPTVKDAALIAAAQRVEHYEMAGYGAVRTFADELGLNDAADLLQETLDEEGATDKKLTKIAKGGLLSKGINEKAKMK